MAIMRIDADSQLDLNNVVRALDSLNDSLAEWLSQVENSPVLDYSSGEIGQEFQQTRQQAQELKNLAKVLADRLIDEMQH